VTAEGERIPVRCEQLDIGYIDGMLLLPLIIEHTIGGWLGCWVAGWAVSGWGF